MCHLAPAFSSLFRSLLNFSNSRGGGGGGNAIVVYYSTAAAAAAADRITATSFVYNPKHGGSWSSINTVSLCVCSSTRYPVTSAAAAFAALVN